MSFTLTPKGLPSLLQSTVQRSEPVVLQVLKPKHKQGENKYYACTLSDGFLKIRAALYGSCKAYNPESCEYCLVKVMKHEFIMANGALRGIEVKEFEVFGFYPEQIGDPVQYSTEAMVSETATNFIDIDKFKPLAGPKKQASNGASKKPIQILNEKGGKKEKRSNTGMMEIQIEAEEGTMKQEEMDEVTERRLKHSERILDLYPDLANWEIVVRIVDMSYKEFVSKKNNKFTQILSLELMDRTGTRVEATVFGEYGKELQDQLKLNSIYRISRGLIKQDTYNTNRGPKYATISISLGQSASIIELKNNDLIPEMKDDQYDTIRGVLEEKDKDKMYEVVGILTDIGEERTFNDRNGKPLTKRMISISDPENSKTIDVTLWRDLKIEEELKGRTVLLKSFKINEYMGNISLNSSFKSQIRPLEQHRYRKYENNLAVEKFDQVSHNQNSDHSNECRSIKKLQEEIYTLGEKETIYSVINGYVSLISFKSKWYYDSCPLCKKGGAAKSSQCTHCGGHIDAPIPKFILPIEIADFSGGIWTTAFDDFANILFEGRTIHDLIGMNEHWLREEAEVRMFQEFRFRIATKKDEYGQVKHSIMGKPAEVSFEKVTQENIHRIYQFD